jgi:hypothetical protein
MKNNWNLEKNPTIVNFPLNDLEMCSGTELLSRDEICILLAEKNGRQYYRIVANICIEEPYGAGSRSFKLHLLNKVGLVFCSFINDSLFT